jgi:RNA polymerase sigma-70 factor (ECF subfamily)
MLEKFMHAADRGDLVALKALFANDAQMISDGGGKALAVRRILQGAERITRLFAAIFKRNPHGIERRLVRVNGEPGLATSYNGKLHSVTTIDTDGESIHAYYTIANPDKLGAFAALQDR